MKRQILTGCHADLCKRKEFALNVCIVPQTLPDKRWTNKVQGEAVDYFGSIVDKPRPEFDVPTVLLGNMCAMCMTLKNVWKDHFNVVKAKKASCLLNLWWCSTLILLCRSYFSDTQLEALSRQRQKLE